MFRAIPCSSAGGQNCIVTASGIVTVCKRLYSMPDESGLQSTVNDCLWRMAIPDAVTIQFDLLKMSMVLLEICRGL